MLSGFSANFMAAPWDATLTVEVRGQVAILLRRVGEVHRPGTAVRPARDLAKYAGLSLTYITSWCHGCCYLQHLHTLY